MTLKIPPPPRKSESTFDGWVRLLYDIVKDFDAGGGAQATNHASLANLNSATYSHVTSTQKTDLTDGGDSALHFHLSDRARANHFGTQPIDSIDGFEAAVAAAVIALGAGGTSSSIIETQVFGS